MSPLPIAIRILCRAKMDQMRNGNKEEEDAFSQRIADLKAKGQSLKVFPFSGFLTHVTALLSHICCDIMYVENNLGCSLLGSISARTR